MANTLHSAHQPVWRFRAVPQGAVERLASDCNIPLPVAHVLYQRGHVTQQAVQRFLEPSLYRHPDPFLMADMNLAVERVVHAIRQGERILVYGDYDVDGQSSTALVVSALQRVGANVGFYIPNRLEEGYGLSEARLRALAPEADLMITVDCGITSVAEALVARDLGLDCIITDHHEPGSEIPEALAVINPKRQDCPYPEKGLAGCGVAFKLISAVYTALGRGQDELGDWLDLVALATIADVVPLEGENRAWVAKGLPRFQDRMGLKTLCDVAGIDASSLKAGHVAFSLAPRLNAAGRLDDAAAGVHLLLSDDPVQALALAQQLDQQNQERQEVERRIFAEASAWIDEHANLDDERALVVAGDGWHRGVIGIVASRLVEAYGRPVLVLSTQGDEAVGSGRSISPFNLYQALSSLKHYFSRFGGHSAAAGLTMSASQVDAFRNDFVALASDRLSEGDLVPIVHVDSIVEADDVTPELAETLGRMSPFGVGNPEPLMVVRDSLVCESRRVGRDQSHWRIGLRVPGAPGGMVSGIGFRLADRFADIVGPGARVDIAGTLAMKVWNGTSQLQLQVRDVRLNPLESVKTIETALMRTISEPLQSAATDAPLAHTMSYKDREVTVRVHDYRQLEGDAAGHATGRARGSSDALLLWTHESGRHGLVSQVCLNHESGRATEAFIFSNGIPETAQIRQTAAVVFWALPPSLDALHTCVYEALGWAEELDIYLTFSESMRQQAQSVHNQRHPDIDVLRDLYRLVRECTTKQGPRLRAADLARSLREQGSAVSEAGVRHGLEVFAEAGLLQYALGDTGEYTVRLINLNGRKVDLTRTVRYNDGIISRERFAGYLAQVASLCGPKLLGLASNEVASA